MLRTNALKIFYAVMRNTQSKAEKSSSDASIGGRNANYLVRSRAYTVRTASQGHKTPKSDYRSQWLQRLNHIELLQNLEVQQTLRTMMALLKKENKILKDSNSAYKFAEQIAVEKSHKNVCSILKKKLGNNTTTSTEYQKDEKDIYFRTNSSIDKATVRNSRQRKEFKDNKQDSLLFSKHHKEMISTNLKCKDIKHPSSGAFVIIHGEKSSSLHQSDDNYVWNDSGLPAQDSIKPGNLTPIQERSSLHTSKQVKGDMSLNLLPRLDPASKLTIIRRAKEIRNKRKLDAIHKSLKLETSSELKNNMQSDQKIDIFADNTKLFMNKPQSDIIAEKPPLLLPLLGAKSFHEIDCDDFLNTENRFNNLSPEPNVLDHQLHWPDRMKHHKSQWREK